MLHPRTLIVYGSSYGQTAKIARYVAGQLIRAGHEVTMARGDQLPHGLSPDTFDGVLVGASVLVGRHQRYIEEFVRRHRAQLNRVPSAFFSVSGSKGSSDPKVVALADKYLSEFLLRTGWHPNLSLAVAGAIAYTKYSPLLRWFMKRISARTGRPTDASRDYELTDWWAVVQFATSFSMLVGERKEAEAVPT